MTHIERLAEHPEAHHVFLALRMLEAHWPQAPGLGLSVSPREDPVRLGQEPSMAFARSTLTDFTPPQGGHPARLTNLFFGLFGPHGPLPAHLTEYARERHRSFRDPTFIAFADMLTHRVFGLLYRAWASGQPTADLDHHVATPTKGRVSGPIAALAGVAGEGLAARDSMPDPSKLHFAASLSRRARTASGLGAMLSGIFAIPVRVEQFIGSWLSLEPSDRWCLGSIAGLGRSTSIGERVWSRSAKIRLVIGPLHRSEYEMFLPGGKAAIEMRDTVRNYLGDTMDWDMNLVLLAEDVPALELGGDTRLGLSSWIGFRPLGKDADDLMLVPPAATARRAGSQSSCPEGRT